MGFLEDFAGLQGKVAVVTGGAGGLGRPISLDLARAGVKVAIVDRDADATTEITKLFAAESLEVRTECFDVRESDRLSAFFDQVDGWFGPLDILVNVPGGSFRTPLLEARAKGVDAVIRQNFTYVVESIQHASKRMIAAGKPGSIINVTSVEAHRAVPNMAIYGAMKAAVAHLSKTLSLELGPTGIRINCVAPDIFPTPATAAWGNKPTDPKLTALNDYVSIPMARTGTSRDLTGPVLFLASDLSAYINGTTVHIDGGTLASSGWFHWGDTYGNTIPEHLLEAMLAARGDGPNP